LVHTGTSWEQFYTNFQPLIHPLGVPVQTLLFALLGDAEPAVNGGGYFIDNVSNLVGRNNPDHFQCYDVKWSSKLRPRPEVSLNDQFGYRDWVNVGKRAVSYCTPVDKNGEGIDNPDVTLTCYRIQKKRLRQKVVIENQFGEQTLMLKKSKLLCVPSTQLSTRPIEKHGHHDH
jgi:hypothetical protein